MQVQRRRGFNGPPTSVLVVVAAIVVGSGIAWWFGTRNRPEPTTMPATPAVAAIQDTVTLETAIPPLELPELSESDAFTRDVVATLSAHPRLAAWLATDDLVNRFVGAVVNLAGGRSPKENVDFMAPEGAFEVRESAMGTVIAPASYRRYNTLTETLTSLDTEGGARLYYQLRPLFETSFNELGIPDWTFDDAMNQAFDNILEVPVTEGPVQVERSRTVYTYTNERLESATAAQKHLMRMGSQNAQRVQNKVRELREAIQALESPAG
ncbi:MAG: DUF3014 domain-containing protein [Longimicrobiales bacterium]